MIPGDSLLATHTRGVPLGAGCHCMDVVEKQWHKGSRSRLYFLPRKVRAFQRRRSCIINTGCRLALCVTLYMIHVTDNSPLTSFAHETGNMNPSNVIPGSCFRSGRLLPVLPNKGAPKPDLQTKNPVQSDLPNLEVEIGKNDHQTPDAAAHTLQNHAASDAAVAAPCA